ncbi:MAG: hypothetical protein WCH34_00280 [Bacteroidota bacterium]
MDFTINIYSKLLDALRREGYAFQTFSDFIQNPSAKTIVLRHDVDLLPYNSLRFAKIQSQLEIKGTYYFRAVPESWDEKVISEIAALGHEVGYHYETMDTANGNLDEAWSQFCFHLGELRKLTTVSSICMHGSPRSKFDNRRIWEKYDYKTLELVAEPYFDVDFSSVFYLTDTGRRWDGYKVSVRDKIPMHQERWNAQGLAFHSTEEIIGKADSLPNQIMFTFHPQRWHDSFYLLTREMLVQRIKNMVKFLLINIKK